jgi:hypothetical protein
MTHDPLCDLAKVDGGCTCAELWREHDHKIKRECDNCGCLCDLIEQVREDQKKRDRGDMWAKSQEALGRAVRVKEHTDYLVAELSRLTYWRAP